MYILIFKVAMTDVRYFPRSTFFDSLVHEKFFWLDMARSFQVRIHLCKGGRRPLEFERTRRKVASHKYYL